jgi:hypothetical protein
LDYIIINEQEIKKRDRLMLITEEISLNIFYLIYLEIFDNINSDHHNHSYDVNEKIFHINIQNDLKSY